MSRMRIFKTLFVDHLNLAMAVNSKCQEVTFVS